MANILNRIATSVAIKDFHIARKINYRQARFLSDSNNQKTTCLYEFHRRKQARMELFAGYMMPIVYKNQTIKSEHLQTRDMSSVFDVSHMMQTIVSGSDRYKFIEYLTVADVESMPIDKCTLSVFTNESGGIIDDCIIGKRKDYLHIVSNAGNAEIVWPWLNSNNLSSKFSNVKLERLVGRGLIALQGPSAAKVLQSKLSKEIDLKEIEFMNTLDADISGIGACHITRCGYTGEDGFEISIDPKQAEQLMESFCSDYGHEVGPAGLGARDTLRLEAGLCLHGHDITDKITPVESALAWTIHKRRRETGGFLGSNIILEQLKNKTAKVKRIGLVATGSGPPAREHSKIMSSDGNKQLGEVTSGTFAPKLEKNIAMGYMSADYATKFDELVMCNVRGKNYEYKLTRMPFVKSNYYFKSKQ